jgi:hypothetical protein
MGEFWPFLFVAMPLESRIPPHASEEGSATFQDISLISIDSQNMIFQLENRWILKCGQRFE